MWFNACFKTFFSFKFLSIATIRKLISRQNLIATESRCYVGKKVYPRFDAGQLEDREVGRIKTGFYLLA